MRSPNADYPPCVRIGVEVFDTIPPIMTEKPKSVIPDKLLEIMQKYKYNWRLDQLSRPTRKTEKYTARRVDVLQRKPPLKISAEKKFFADQMSRPALRLAVANLRQFGPMNGRKYRALMKKTIRRIWDSIYNYYRRKTKEKEDRQKRWDAKRAPKVERKFNKKRMAEMALPKPVPKPPVDTAPKKIFTDLERLDTLAMPKEVKIEPPRPLGYVNPAALQFEPNEIVMKLAQIPERFKNVLPPLVPGLVNRSALRYKASPRIIELAEPKRKSERQKIDEDFDPFAISKNALKYKATPRILELAKPLERD